MLVTNSHVIDGADEILAKSDRGDRYALDKIYAVDSKKDLAILAETYSVYICISKEKVDGKISDIFLVFLWTRLRRETRRMPQLSEILASRSSRHATPNRIKIL